MLHWCIRYGPAATIAHLYSTAEVLRRHRNTANCPEEDRYVWELVEEIIPDVLSSPSYRTPRSRVQLFKEICSKGITETGKGKGKGKGYTAISASEGS